MHTAWKLKLVALSWLHPVRSMRPCTLLVTKTLAVMLSHQSGAGCCQECQQGCIALDPSHPCGGQSWCLLVDNNFHDASR